MIALAPSYTSWNLSASQLPPDALQTLALPVSPPGKPLSIDGCLTSICFELICHDMRDHGGNLDAAIASFGGRPEDWVDLSTGINRVPYGMPELHPSVWQRLPTKGDIQRLLDVARRAYATRAAILPVAGAQAAIQLIPQLRPAGHAGVLSPTYNEHRAALEAHGWAVVSANKLGDLEGLDLAVVVNPNNPDGRLHTRDALFDLAKRVGLLVVDESFMDATPEMSLAPLAGECGLVALRSFGKFYGLAGVRLGFAIGATDDILRLTELAGPWNVSGAAIEIGRIALADTRWASATATRLHADAKRLDELAERSGFELVGGTALFRLYDCNDALLSQNRLAERHVWSRIFPWSQRLVRLGLPGPEREWQRVESALVV